MKTTLHSNYIWHSIQHIRTSDIVIERVSKCIDKTTNVLIRNQIMFKDFTVPKQRHNNVL